MLVLYLLIYCNTVTLMQEEGNVFVTITNFYRIFFFFSSRRRHTRCGRDWSSDVCSSDLAGRTTRYIFNLTGYLTNVINPDGHQITYSYCNGIAGLLQQLCSMTDPSGGTTTFGYSSAWLGPNQVTSVTDRRNVHTTFTYYPGYP